MPNHGLLSYGESRVPGLAVVNRISYMTKGDH
jgi:hypothetical protein